MIRSSCGVLVLKATLLAVMALARPAALPAQIDTLVRPTVGLVLSGGSAKGFAHIGVLRALAERGIEADVVTGASMGAIIGALHATGVDVDSLETLARDLPWAGILRDRPERSRVAPDQRAYGSRTVMAVPFADGRVQLPSGAVDGTLVYRLLADLTWPWAGIRDFRSLPVRFAAIATDLETGEAVRLTTGVLTDALRASMSLPGAVAPFLLDGRLLADGGLSRNLPASDARALGADFVICSDVSDPLGDASELESMLEVLLQTVAFRMNESNEEERHLCDVLIRPDIEGLSSVDFGRAAAWITRGEEAARATLPESFSASRAPRSDVAEARPDSVRLTRVTLEAPTADARRVAERILGVEEAGWLRRRDLDAAFGELAATDLFCDMRYRIDGPADSASLNLDLRERPEDALGLGFRYDDRFGASLLFNLTLKNRLRYGSVIRADVRLGDEIQIQGNYLRGRGVTGPFSLGLTGGWTRAPFDIHDQGIVVARVKVDVLTARALVGSTVGRGTLVGLDIGAEWGRSGTVVAARDSSVAQALGSAALVVFRETFDDPDFPTRGGRVYLRSEWGMGDAAAGGGFQHQVADLSAAVPMTPTTTFLIGAYVGAAGGRDLPLHRRFHVGGIHPSAAYATVHPTFAGLEPQARTGTVAQVGRLGVRWAVEPGRYLTLGTDFGATLDSWTLAPEDWLVGWRVSAAGASIVGPIELTVHGRRLGNLAVGFSVGRRF